MKKLVYTLVFLFNVTISLKAQFNYYYGNIHSQTSYSDGNKDSSTSLITTPLQAFNYANQSQQIDFYGISDHNHLSAGMSSPAHFHMGIADANTANADGSFVALYGQEWGVISGGGHAIIYGMDSLMGWDSGDYDIYVAQSNYATLWSKVNARPGVFAYLAHPQQTDYTNLFTTALNSAADNAIIGMAARSGPAFSTNNTYSDPSTSDYIARYKDALSLGYHLGVGLDHDTHNSVFGRQTAGRLVIAAPALTRYNILDAMRKMRFYSSDDWNVKVNFTINSQPIGSIYTHVGTPTINVTVSDPDAENTSSISVYYGVPGSGTLPTVLTTAANTNSLTYNHSVANLGSYYYYLEITQADGDVIWTSPIWYTRNDLMTANPPVTNFSVTGTTHCVGQPIALGDLSTNAPTNWSWTMLGASSNSSTAQNPTVTYTAAGTYSIVLIASNGIGTGLPVTKTLTVGNPVTLSVSATSNSICSGKTVTLTASGATSYTWSSGVNTSSTAVTPTANSVFTVTGNSGGCAASKNVTITVFSSPTVSVNSPSICSGAGTATLTATGATSYTWSTGATTATVVVNPVTTTIYTVTGKIGSCSNIRTATVTVKMSPTVTVNSATICSGATATLSAGGANSYLWNTGSTATVIYVSPAATAVYTVTGSSTGCNNLKTATVTVNASPTVVVNSATVCAGNNATLTSTGANTYLWNTGSTNASLVIAPAVTTTYNVTGTSAGCTQQKTATVTVNASPTLAVTTASTCAGGSATVTAAGAGSYLWNTGSTSASIIVSPAVTTTYNVTGTSAGCSQLKTTTVTVYATPTVNVNSAVICSGNSATLTATGANTYSWSTGPTGSVIVVSPSTTTQYTVTGNVNGCKSSKSGTVTVNSLTVSVNSPTLCNGGSIVLSATGAGSYSWNTGASTATILVSPAFTNTYAVTGFSGACSNSKTSTVTVYSTPTVNLSSTANTVCAGGSVSLTASGALTYSWNTGSTASLVVSSPTITTVYTATGSISSGCNAASSRTITVNQLPSVSIAGSSTTICSGQVSTLTASGAFSYTWSTGSNGASAIISPTTTSSYTVEAEDINNCYNNAMYTQSVVICTATEYSSEIRENILIYPNPSSGFVTLSMPTTFTGAQIVVKDLLGRIILMQDSETTKEIIDMRGYVKGIYFLTVLASNKNIVTVKIIIE